MNRRGDKTANSSPDSTHDLHEAQRLMHELQVHQTELEQQNEELHRLRDEVEAGLARYMDLYDFAPVGYLTLGPSGEIQQLNLAASSQLHVERSKAIGRPLVSFVKGTHRRTLMEFLPQAFASSEHESCVVALEGTESSTVQLETTSSPDHMSCRVAMLDISARIRSEQLESQLRESQKMEALGTLAGGIAHDFNNILGTIIGNTLLGSESIDTDHPARLCFSEIGKASARAKHLVEQILSFSRKRPTLYADQSLQGIVDEAIRLMRATLPVNIVLNVTMPDSPLAVRADGVQIQQVLLNIIANAFEAMPSGGGRVGVSVDVQTVAADAGPGSVVLPPGQYARISIADTGSGMEPDVVERIFEPFFTTKPVDKGTGLGLSVAHGIIKGHGGAITVHSEPRTGTRFDVFLPVIAVRPSPAAIVAAPATNNGHRKHILYLDDDESMTFVVKRLLERLSYRVSVFERPADALAAVRADPQGFDVVVTDFNMPGASGLHVAKEVGEIRANLPVIVTSGYVTEELQAAARELGVKHVLYKPNTTDELCQHLHQLLSPQKSA